MYTPEQNNFLEAVQAKTQAFFLDCNPPAHGHDHALRVAVWARSIAEAEGARSVWLCEVAAVLHDIGRVPEYRDGRTERHQELSYELLREWFAEDRLFNFLSIEEKIELLYAVRYHWNDEADDYDTAWILRDADKLDSFGDIGLTRTEEMYSNDPQKLLHDLRLRYHMVWHLHTATAKGIVRRDGLLEPIVVAEAEAMRSAIEPIEL